MTTWEDVQTVQPVTSKILMNSLQNNRISHAYLIEGMRGTGKSSIAQLLAMTIFCDNPVGIEPCQSCLSCKRIPSRNHPDVHWIEPEGRSITKGQIDRLVKEFEYTGFESNRKVYIISGIESLTTNAANRMLKFLEEPNVETTAILLTENLQAVISTIQSRCQILRLQPLPPAHVEKRLTYLHISEQRARFLGALTNNLDEALALDEEAEVYKMRELALRFMEVLMNQHDERFLWLHQSWINVYSDRNDHDQLLHIILLTMQDVLNSQVDQTYITKVFSHEDSRLEKAQQHYYPKKLLKMIHAVLQARQRLKQNIHPTLLLEDFVLQL